MSTAVICLAYLQNPSGVDNLARYFARLSADLYVHVDAKVPDTAYRTVAADHANLHLLAERLPIWWGGFNTVRAIVAALTMARANGSYDRYLLLTEDTVPLLAPAALARHLEANVEYIETGGPVPEEPESWIWRRYSGWYFYDSAATNPRFIDPDRREITSNDLIELLEMQRLRQRGKAPLAELRHGSGWWALTDEAVVRILHVHETDPWLRDSFAFSAIPEEQYFQTILALSGWTRPCQRFIHTDFSREPKPYVYRTADELIALRHGAACMARKVDLAAPEIAAYMRTLTET